MVIRVTVREGYSTEVVNPLITSEHNAVNAPGVCLVRGAGDEFEGNGVCKLDEIVRLEVISE